MGLGPRARVWKTQSCVLRTRCLLPAWTQKQYLSVHTHRVETMTNFFPCFQSAWRVFHWGSLSEPPQTLFLLPGFGSVAGSLAPNHHLAKADHGHLITCRPHSPCRWVFPDLLASTLAHRYYPPLEEVFLGWAHHIWCIGQTSDTSPIATLGQRLLRLKIQA